MWGHLNVALVFWNKTLYIDPIQQKGYLFSSCVVALFVSLSNSGKNFGMTHWYWFFCFNLLPWFPMNIKRDKRVRDYYLRHICYQIWLFSHWLRVYFPQDPIHDSHVGTRLQYPSFMWPLENIVKWSIDSIWSFLN